MFLEDFVLNGKKTYTIEKGKTTVKLGKHKNIAVFIQSSLAIRKKIYFSYRITINPVLFSCH